MSVIALDTETTTWNKGSPYDPRNKMVCWSFATDVASGCRTTGELGYLAGKLPYKKVIGFNFKFDLHWFKKYDVDFSKAKVWDVQLAEFIISCQTSRFPSLNDTCIKYSIPVKDDVVKTQYWDKGIQTDEIPWDILSNYATHDAEITLQCYYAQLEVMTPQQIKLCELMCEDLKILQEMEQNGIVFNEQLCTDRAGEIDDQISTITEALRNVYPNVPINFGSNDHLSAFLYGGIVKEDSKEHIGFFKSGERAGQPKYKNVVIEHTLPRVYQPLKGSEMAKVGNYAVDEGTLRKLKGNKERVSMLLELAKLEKLNGTYYRGLIKLRKEMGWDENMLHGNFNQTTAISGRLSSSRPNLQNFASDLQDIFITRHND